MGSATGGLRLATAVALCIGGVVVAWWGWSMLSAPGGFVDNFAGGFALLAVLLGLGLLIAGIVLGVWAARRRPRQ